MRPTGIVVRLTCLSITVGLVFWLFAGWALAAKTVKVRASYSDSVAIESVKKDLAKLDAYAASGNYGEAGVLVGKDIKARDVYRAYLTRAVVMSDELIGVRKQLAFQADTISLQQLGAVTQRLDLNNLHFKSSFQHGEDQFQTYQLIEKAIKNLDDAISYWRLANRYNRFYRGSLKEKMADDEVLKTKIQAAMIAIDELKAIAQTREALTRDLSEDD